MFCNLPLVMIHGLYISTWSSLIQVVASPILLVWYQDVRRGGGRQKREELVLSLEEEHPRTVPYAEVRQPMWWHRVL